MSYESPLIQLLDLFFSSKIETSLSFPLFFFCMKIFNEVKENIFSHLFNFPKDTQLTLGRIGGKGGGGEEAYKALLGLFLDELLSRPVVFSSCAHIP